VPEIPFNIAKEIYKEKQEITDFFFMLNISSSRNKLNQSGKCKVSENLSILEQGFGIFLKSLFLML